MLSLRLLWGVHLPHDLKRCGVVMLGRFPEPSQRFFARKQVDLLAEEHSMLPCSAHQVSLLQIHDWVVPGEHWCVKVGIGEETLLLGCSGKQVSPPSMHCAPTYVT